MPEMHFWNEKIIEDYFVQMCNNLLSLHKLVRNFFGKLVLITVWKWEFLECRLLRLNLLKVTQMLQFFSMSVSREI